MKLTFVTPEKKIVEKVAVEYVTVPAFRGELNILPKHAPLMTTLGAGILKFKIQGDKEEQKFAISWGYCHISAIGIQLLAENAEKKEDINIENAQKLIKENYNRLATEFLTDDEWNKLHNEILKNEAEVSLVTKIL